MAADLDQTPEPPIVGEAATVVVLRDGSAGLEVLLLERLSTGSFGGAWAFPGGRVDPEDARPEDPQPEEDPHSEDSAHDAGTSLGAPLAVPLCVPLRVRRAAVRETLEETGLVVPEDSLVPFSRWVPPLRVTKRLITWFFLAPDPVGELAVSADEHVDAAWLPPSEALRLHAAGGLQLFPPTWITLDALGGASSVAEALAAAPRPPKQFESFQLRGADGRLEAVLWAGDAQYGDPAAKGGARHRLWINSLPWRLERST